MEFRGFILMVVCVVTMAPISAQRRVMELTFKDSTIKTGRGKLKGNTVKFKAHKKAKMQTYHFSTLERVRTKDKYGIRTYVYLKVRDKENAVVAEEVTTGKVKLYRQMVHGSTPGFNNGGGPNSGVGFVGGYTYTVNDFYLKRNNETEATHIMGADQIVTKKFKKTTAIFFGDCTALIQKIQSGEYRKKDMKAIVEFYNTKCN